ncbi:MAG: PIN domain-containing protein, partial [Alphaproteobacteria bacterium]|nr:PIN domain-containing protein [Alphaproteobacteria bacterium]
MTGIPDQNDRHVVAAAIHAKAQVIVTSNLRHFPSEALEPWDIEAKHPDDFLADTIDLAPGLVVTAVTEMRDALKDPPKTIDELIDDFDRAGLVQTASRLRSIFTGAATWRGTD